MSGGGRIAYHPRELPDYLKDAIRDARMRPEYDRLDSMMSDPPQSDKPAERSIYDQVVENLDKRIVPEPARKEIRKALDKADAPLTGRAGANEALGRVTRR